VDEDDSEIPCKSDKFVPSPWRPTLKGPVLQPEDRIWFQEGGEELGWEEGWVVFGQQQGTFRHQRALREEVNRAAPSADDRSREEHEEEVDAFTRLRVFHGTAAFAEAAVPLFGPGL
jgi:hypothetical protein